MMGEHTSEARELVLELRAIWVDLNRTIGASEASTLVKTLDAPLRQVVEAIEETGHPAAQEARWTFERLTEQAERFAGQARTRDEAVGRLGIAVNTVTRLVGVDVGPGEGNG